MLSDIEYTIIVLFILTLGCVTTISWVLWKIEKTIKTMRHKHG